MPYCTSCECDVTAEVNESDGFTCAPRPRAPWPTPRFEPLLACATDLPLRARCCTLCGKVLDDTLFSTDATFSKGPGGASQARPSYARSAPALGLRLRSRCL
jgi:hypothetical protein